MNFQANKLKMSSTYFDSPHGLMNKFNYSTASDVAILTAECMKMDLFRKVVGTEEYETQALGGSPNIDGKVNQYKWVNSNKLLGKYPGILGCKTGITAAAGPCFAGYYENGDIKLAIILCNSKTMDHRWSEIKALVEWYHKNKQIKEIKEQKEKMLDQQREATVHLQNIKKMQANYLRL
jgi:serine-type D-Ala-D-Ala carboxypeptidase (penicillin-binding protein 5/6)